MGGGGVILAEKVLVVTMRTGAETPAAVGGCVLYGWTIVNYGEHSTVAFIQIIPYHPDKLLQNAFILKTLIPIKNVNDKIQWDF